MASKGDRARLEPVARQMFVDGQTLVAIEETLGVSRQTLADWKEWGGWDKAKASKDQYEHQLVKVRDEIMERVTEAPLQAASYLDSLAKIEAILDKRARNAREAADAVTRQKAEMFLQFIKDFIEYSSKHDQVMAEYIQGNFDDIIQWGRNKYAQG